MSSVPTHSNLAVQIASWRDGSTGFLKFIQDVQPRVRSHHGGFTPYQLVEPMRSEIVCAIDTPDLSVAVFCWPRRHGKTVASAMVIVWRFLTRQTENVAVVANSEKQVLSTAFRTIRDCFSQTPLLQKLVKSGTIRVLQDSIELPGTGSIIQAFSANPSALWGKALSCAQISELHAAPKGDEVFAALAGSLLDTEGSLMLVDSTASPRSSKLFELYQIANRDDDPDRSIAFSHIQYSDIEDAMANCPPWLNETKLRSLSRQMLPHDFALMHLNRWGDAQSVLFPSDVLASATEEYPLDIEALTNGAAYVTGAGLDRAFGGSKHGDATVTACVLKTSIDDEEHFYVLDADSVFLGRLGGIKSRFIGYHSDHHLSRAVFESYGAQDVADWADAQEFAEGCETIHPSRRTKYSAIMMLYQAAAEQRLHIHPSFKKLLSELAVFEVISDGKASDGQASIPKFSHPRGLHDDYVMALAWAIYSLRSITLNPYELEGIACHGRGADIEMCALNGGGHVPLCARSCRSMIAANRLHELHANRNSTNPLSFEAFIAAKVVNTGSHSLPR